MTRHVETLVVGAGISGLAYAHARGRDADLVLLEASDRVGGLVRTEAIDEARTLRYECGPETLRFEADGGLTDMLRELELHAERPPRTARRRFLAFRGRLVEAPLGILKFLRTPLLSWRGKLRMIREPWRDLAIANDGSVADFVRHRIGDEALAALLDPLVSGIHAGATEHLSMRACFPRLVELVERHGGLFRAQWKLRGEPAPSVMKTPGGCQTITDALQRCLSSKIVLQAPVQSITRQHDRWQISSASGAFEAERLVLAVPATAAAQLLAHAAPEISSRIAEIRSESLVSFTHVYCRDEVAHPLNGFGYLVASREKMQHLGTLFSSSIAPNSAPRDRVILRTLLGGARAPHLVDASEIDLLSIVCDEVHPLLGIHTAPAIIRIQRWHATLPRFDLAHPQRVAAIEAASPPELGLLGNYLRGIGVNHLVATARKLALAHQSPLLSPA